MTSMNTAAQVVFGYYYFLPLKRNSDVCCRKFSGSGIRFQMPHELLVRHFF